MIPVAPEVWGTRAVMATLVLLGWRSHPVSSLLPRPSLSGSKGGWHYPLDASNPGGRRPFLPLGDLVSNWRNKAVSKSVLLQKDWPQGRRTDELCIEILTDSAIQSEWPLITLDSVSAITFFFPGRCCAVNRMCLSRNQIHNYLASLAAWVETVLPRLLYRPLLFGCPKALILFCWPGCSGKSSLPELLLTAQDSLCGGFLLPWPRATCPRPMSWHSPTLEGGIWLYLNIRLSHYETLAVPACQLYLPPV